MTDTNITVIEARSPKLLEQVKAAFRHRFFYPVLFNEISMRRYRQTLLGVWWLLVRPLIPAVITVILFTKVVPLDTHGEPYPIFFLSSYITWTLFQSVVQIMPRALVWSSVLMRRTYFPKLLLPVASIGPPLVETLVIFGLYALTVVYFGIRTGDWWINTGPALLLFPVCMVAALALGLAVGMVLTVVAAFVRDMIYMTTYVVQVFMLMTPVLYSSKLIPSGLREAVLLLNPMASIIETARYSLTGAGEAAPVYLLVSLPLIAVLLVVASWFFVKAEPYIADQL
jgi:lipopolysaccharide transport system permease protein